MAEDNGGRVEIFGASTRQGLQERADRELAERSVQSSLLPFALLLLTAAVTREEHSDHGYVLWLFGSLLLGVGLYRAYVGIRFAGLYGRRAGLWRVLFKGGTYATAAVWGTYASLTVQFHDNDHILWLTLLVTTGLAAGASVSLSPDPALARHYILILLGPTVAIAALKDSLHSFAVAGMVALYTAFLAVQSRSISAWFWNAVTQEERHQARSRELQERTEYLDALIRESPLAIVALDPAQTIRLCNPAFERLFQYRQEEIVGRNLDELIQTEESAEENARLSRQALEGIPVHVTTRRRRKDGSTVEVELHGVPLRQQGRLTGLFALYEDITERRQAEARLEEAHQRLERQMAELNQLTREINALSEVGSFLQSCHTPQEAYAMVGHAAGRLFGNDRGALYIISPSKDAMEAVATWGSLPGSEAVLAPQQCWAMRMGQLHAHSAGDGRPPCWHAAEGESEPSLCAPLMAQGETLGVLHLRAASGTADGEAWLGSRSRLGAAFAEEAALALANLYLREKLQAQSIRDPLTGLFNRRYMEESLERELRRAARRNHPVSVLMVDMDHFKRFNDTFGHEAGDVLLKELARMLRQQVRGEDIVCRYGGEEFTVILPEAGLEAAVQRGEQLRRAAGLLGVRHQGQELGPVTLSIGVASFPQHGATASLLLRGADQALYAAKASGRNRVTAVATAPFPPAPRAMAPQAP